MWHLQLGYVSSRAEGGRFALSAKQVVAVPCRLWRFDVEDIALTQFGSYPPVWNLNLSMNLMYIYCNTLVVFRMVCCSATVQGFSIA